VIPKLAFGAAITFVVAVGVAAPAGADPSVFGNLSCSCDQANRVSNSGPGDDVTRGVQNGLADLQGVHR